MSEVQQHDTPLGPARRHTTAADGGLRGTLRGLFHAHVGWLFIHTQRGLKERYARDLIDDPVISWVNRTFFWWVAAGLALNAGSALTRFGIFKAGMVSAHDPKYTVIPQRARIARRRADAERAAGAEATTMR